MDEVSRFLGTWVVEPVEHLSSHTFTWRLDRERLQGRWIIEAAEGAPTQAARAQGLPTTFEMKVEAPCFEDGALMFLVNGGPHSWEFRLVDDVHAVVGAAADKLPPAIAARHGRSIASHRVRLTRQPPAAADPNA